MQNGTLTEYHPELYWDSTYAIVLALMEQHPALQPETVGLLQLAQLIQSLPGFMDDPAIVNDRILQDILIVWYEETKENQK